MPAHLAQPASRGADLNAARECLIERMVEQLRGRGYFLAHIDAHAGQLLADVRWAAQLAGQVVGRPTRTYASRVGNRLPGVISVVVAPVETWAAAPGTDGHVARAMVERQLRIDGRGGGQETA